jgi:hypothetical protein
MKLKNIWICVAGFAVLSCSNSEDQNRSASDASGTYVREYAIEVTHLETGNKIGMRQIRDSIFVQATNEGYKVTNRKWRMNDYDQEGWVSMAHADDRPIPTFLASYDEQSHQLSSKSVNVTHSLFIKNGRLFRDSSKNIEYKKIQ